MPRSRDAKSGPTQLHCEYDPWERRFPIVCPLRRVAVIVAVMVLIAGLVRPAEARVLGVPVPQELKSFEYTVEANGRPVDVAHAAASYDYVSLEATTAVR